MRKHWYYFTVLVPFLAGEQAFAQADSKKPVLERIFADWKQRQNLLKSARYVINGTIEYKDKELPPGNPVRPKRLELLLDLERRRWRMQTSQEIISQIGNGWEYKTRVGTCAFDGKA